MDLAEKHRSKPPPWSALTASCRRNSSPCRVLHRDEDATEPLSILSLGLCDSHRLADVAGSPPPAVARGRPSPSPSRLRLVLRVSSRYSPLASRAIGFSNRAQNRFNHELRRGVPNSGHGATAAATVPAGSCLSSLPALIWSIQRRSNGCS